MALEEGEDIRWIRFLERQSPKRALVLEIDKPGLGKRMQLLLSLSTAWLRHQIVVHSMEDSAFLFPIIWGSVLK